MPIPPKFLTTKELAQVTAGGDDYIRTKNNKIRGLALRLDSNPYAPKAPGEVGIIVFGNGPRRKARAHLFLETGAIAPTYIKRDTKLWEYFGDYRATKILQDEVTIKKYCGNRSLNTQAGVLFIEPVLEPEVQISGGYADQKNRKEVEIAAIKFVTEELERRGFQVQSRESKNLGFDLEAISPSVRLLVEVKGTDYSEPRFFLTRKERWCSCEQDEWRLFIVCSARHSPILYEYTADEMCRQFTFDSLAWECIRNIS